MASFWHPAASGGRLLRPLARRSALRAGLRPPFAPWCKKRRRANGTPASLPSCRPPVRRLEVGRSAPAAVSSGSISPHVVNCGGRNWPVAEMVAATPRLPLSWGRRRSEKGGTPGWDWLPSVAKKTAHSAFAWQPRMPAFPVREMPEVGLTPLLPLPCPGRFFRRITTGMLPKCRIESEATKASVN